MLTKGVLRIGVFFKFTAVDSTREGLRNLRYVLLKYTRINCWAGKKNRGNALEQASIIAK